MGLKFKSTGLVPPGGWYFIEEDGTKITSHSPQDLIIQVAKYRGKNGIAPGDPTEEVTNQLCGRWVAGCNGIAAHEISATYAPVKRDWLPMAKKFLAVVNRLAKKGVALVSDEMADDRASICVNCPFNVPAHQARGGCQSCGKNIFNQLAEGSIEVFRKTILGTKKTTYNERLQTCQKCGCDLKLKVWIPKDVLGHTAAELELMPSFCWLK